MLLLQVEPLQVQSSHLSFQEYYAARAICSRMSLSGSPPWQWPAWWANPLKLGAEMGLEFQTGLWSAACARRRLDCTHPMGPTNSLPNHGAR